MRFTAIVALLCGLIPAAGVAAQTWSAERMRPPLWQINSVDASGEPSWPYGSEDIAGDGVGAYEDDEAGADLRSVYADADGERLWLRAYVSGETEPAPELVAFFFLDIDDRTDMGGDAAGPPLWPEWTADPSAGGYERVGYDRVARVRAAAAKAGAIDRAAPTLAAACRDAHIAVVAVPATLPHQGIK